MYLRYAGYLFIFVSCTCTLLCMQKHLTDGAYDFCLRKIQADDFNRGYLSLLGQLTRVDAEHITLDRFLSFFQQLSPYHLVYVIEDTKRRTVVAAATLFIEKKCIHGMGLVGHIEDVVVDESLRGYGLGRSVVDFLVDYARDMGAYKVILDCSQDNAPFYEKCDFVRKGVEMALYFDKNHSGGQ